MFFDANKGSSDTHIGSISMVYLPIDLVDFYGKLR